MLRPASTCIARPERRFSLFTVGHTAAEVHRPVSGHVGIRRALSLLAAAFLVCTILSSSAASAELPVLHTVVRVESRTGRLDLRTLKPVAAVSIGETWVDRERDATRIVTRRDGMVAEDSVCAAPACSSGATNPTPSQTERTYRSKVLADLRTGKARVLRTGMLHGQQVRWLRYGKPGEGQVIVVDPSYRVVREEDWHQGRLMRSMETLVHERIARRESDFVTHAPWPDITGQSKPEGNLVKSADAARAVPGAQWAGPQLGALKLNAIRERPWSATTKAGDTISGTMLHLRYGDWLGSFFHPRKRTPGAGVDIVESNAHSPARWGMSATPGLRGEYIPPPAGLAEIHGEQAYIKLGFANLAVAVLQKDGAWMIVRATSYPLLLKTLRALKPIA